MRRFTVNRHQSYNLAEDYLRAKNFVIKNYRHRMRLIVGDSFITNPLKINSKNIEKIVIPKSIDTLSNKWISFFKSVNSLRVLKVEYMPEVFKYKILLPSFLSKCKRIQALALDFKFYNEEEIIYWLDSWNKSIKKLKLLTI